MAGARFGFKHIMVVTDKEDNFRHSEMRLGNRLIHVGSEWADFAARPPVIDGRNTQMIHVQLKEGIDAHCARARSGGPCVSAQAVPQSPARRLKDQAG